MRKYDYFWLTERDWWHWDEATGERILNDDAPEEAKKSYAHYLEQCEQVASEIRSGDRIA